MSVFFWLRIARKVTGLAAQPEYSCLESLLKEESDNPSDGYRIASYVVPPLIGVLGLGVFIPLALIKNPDFILGAVVTAAIAAATWVVFDRLDKAIAPSLSQIRKSSKSLLYRMVSFTNIVGVEPALDPEVGEILDEAAGIYMKHSAAIKEGYSSASKIATALEDAMARMMDLSTPVGARAQEMELARGWAPPLLQEMRDADKALDQHVQAGLPTQTTNDPLAALREARMELQMTDAASQELEQNQRG